MLSSIRKIKGGGSRGERDSRVFTRVHNWYIVCSIYERGGGGGGSACYECSRRGIIDLGGTNVEERWRDGQRGWFSRFIRIISFCFFLQGGGREEIDTRGRELRALRFIRQNSICWRKRTQRLYRWPIILNFRYYIFDSRAILTKVLI